MDMLSRLIHDALDNREWRAFNVGKKNIPFTHLMFADDLILFGECRENTLDTVQNTLHIFMSSSGQKVNCDKSKLYVSPNTSLNDMDQAEQILGVKASKDLGMYLGFPLSPNRPKRRDVECIVNKVRGKLSNWKTIYLSKAGRACLANATLNLIPSYYMQNIHLPMATLHELDKVVSDFI